MKSTPWPPRRSNHIPQNTAERLRVRVQGHAVNPVNSCMETFMGWPYVLGLYLHASHTIHAIRRQTGKEIE